MTLEDLADQTLNYQVSYMHVYVMYTGDIATR